MRTLWILVLATALLALPAISPAQQQYDIVLAGGRVLDPETGLDAIRNVGILDDRIAAISEAPLEGSVVVDAAGLVVSPGFIDLHAHGQTARANEYQARDGVTTALELEDGVLDVGAFLRSREGDAIINYGATISHGASRAWVMPQYADAIKSGLDAYAARDEDAFLVAFTAIGAANYERLDAAAYAALHERLRQGLREGGLGVGMAHQYFPGADHGEIFSVFRFAGELDVPIFTHVREMGISAIQEVLANALATGAPLHIVHLNSSSLWDIETNLALIGGARARGLDVTTEAYPYTAASTSLESAIFDEGWQDRLRISYGDLQWQDTGERLTEETFREYRAKGGVVIIHMMKPEWIATALASPFVMVASDGMPYAPGAHPRGAGTFSRVLGRYAREDELVSLMEAVTKMTLMPARRLEVIVPAASRKGRLQVGADADITIFDPGQVLDTATFEGGLSYSEGVRHVLVNGTFVVRDGNAVEGARPGRALVGRLTGH